MSSYKSTSSTLDSQATTYSLLTTLLVTLLLSAGGYFAYQQGYLDPLIEKVGVLVFKAKAVAEAKEMQAKGLKAGEDFVGCKSFLRSLTGLDIEKKVDVGHGRGERKKRRFQGWRRGQGSDTDGG